MQQRESFIGALQPGWPPGLGLPACVALEAFEYGRLHAGKERCLHHQLLALGGVGPGCELTRVLEPSFVAGIAGQQGGIALGDGPQAFECCEGLVGAAAGPDEPAQLVVGDARIRRDVAAARDHGACSQEHPVGRHIVEGGMHGLVSGDQPSSDRAGTPA